MIHRNVFWVGPHDPGWQVKQGGRVLSSHAVKSAAVSEGRRIAKANGPSQLRVMRKDGTIEFENAYQLDPFAQVG